MGISEIIPKRLIKIYENISGISEEKIENRKIYRIKDLEKQRIDYILAYIVGKSDTKKAKDLLRIFEEVKKTGELESFGISKDTSYGEKFHPNSEKTLGEYKNEIFANLYLDEIKRPYIYKLGFDIKKISPDILSLLCEDDIIYNIFQEIGSDLLLNLTVNELDTLKIIPIYIIQEVGIDKIDLSNKFYIEELKNKGFFRLKLIKNLADSSSVTYSYIKEYGYIRYFETMGVRSDLDIDTFIFLTSKYFPDDLEGYNKNSEILSIIKEEENKKDKEEQENKLQEQENKLQEQKKTDLEFISSLIKTLKNHNNNLSRASLLEDFEKLKKSGELEGLGIKKGTLYDEKINDKSRKTLGEYINYIFGLLSTNENEQKLLSSIGLELYDISTDMIDSIKVFLEGTCGELNIDYRNFSGSNKLTRYGLLLTIIENGLFKYLSNDTLEEILKKQNRSSEIPSLYHFLIDYYYIYESLDVLKISFEKLKCLVFIPHEIIRATGPSNININSTDYIREIKSNLHCGNIEYFNILGLNQDLEPDILNLLINNYSPEELVGFSGAKNFINKKEFEIKLMLLNVN